MNSRRKGKEKCQTKAMNVLSEIDWNLTPSSVRNEDPLEVALSLLEVSAKENPLTKKALGLLKAAISSPSSQKSFKSPENTSLQKENSHTTRVTPISNQYFRNSKSVLKERLFSSEEENEDEDEEPVKAHKSNNQSQSRIGNNDSKLLSPKTLTKSNSSVKKTVQKKPTYQTRSMKTQVGNSRVSKSSRTHKEKQPNPAVQADTSRPLRGARLRSSKNKSLSEDSKSDIDIHFERSDKKNSSLAHNSDVKNTKISMISIQKTFNSGIFPNPNMNVNGSFKNPEETESRRVTRSSMPGKSNVPLSLFCSMINASVLNKDDIDKVFDITTTSTKNSSKSTRDNSSASRGRKKSLVQKEHETLERDEDGASNETSQKIPNKTGGSNKTTSNASISARSRSFGQKEHKTSTRDSNTIAANETFVTVGNKTTSNATLNKTFQRKRRRKPLNMPNPKRKKPLNETTPFAVLEKSEAVKNLTVQFKGQTLSPRRSTISRSNVSKTLEQNGVEPLEEQANLTPKTKPNPSASFPKKQTPHPSKKRGLSVSFREDMEDMMTGDAMTGDTGTDDDTEEDTGDIFKNEKIQRRKKVMIPIKKKSTNEIEQRGDLVFPPCDIKWKAPGKNSTNDDLLVFRMSGEAGSFIGHLLIKGRKSKGEQKTKDQLFLYVIRGPVWVTINDYKWRAISGETIIIPSGQRYNLENKSNHDIRLMFSTAKS